MLFGVLGGFQYPAGSHDRLVDQPGRQHGVHRDEHILGHSLLIDFNEAPTQEALDAILERKPGLKVIIAEGECQLERQRRIRPVLARLLGSGARVVRTRFGVDDETCSGDHSCIRLSGCPSLTLKASSDPLKVDPVAHVNHSCVGCGLCGEVAHAAILCPSFYRAEVVQNPGAWDRLLARLRGTVIGWLQPA